MASKSDETKRRPAASGVGREDHSNGEDMLKRALGTLRLLNDKKNPLSLEQVLAQARQRADIYRRWVQSGALIKDIVVRLSDGEEFAIDQSNIVSLCGLHFRSAFPADAVLHVWKKADEEFDEVPLLSLSLHSVPPNGSRHEKVYPNGQTLSLRVDRCADGQFHVGVDCTQPHSEKARAVGHSGYSLLPLLVPVALAVVKLGSLASHALRKAWYAPQPSPALVYVLLLGFGCLLGMNLSSGSAHSGEATSARHAAVVADESPSVKYMVVASGKESPGTLQQQQLTQAATKKESNPPAGNSRTNANTLLATVIVGSFARADGVDARSHHTRDKSPRSAGTSSDEAGGTLAKGETGNAGDATGRQATDEPSGGSNLPTMIYVNTVDRGNPLHSEDLRKAFIGALKNAERFVMVTDNDGLEQACRIDLRFAPRKEDQGIIFAELYDSKGNLLWHDNRICSKLPDGSSFEDATQELVAEILSTFDLSKSKERNGTE
jgi:hypothetical protein